MPLVAVLRADAASRYDAVIDVLVDHDIRSIELTLTTPGTLDRVTSIVDRVGASVDVGVGTVTKVEEAKAAIDRGAHYLVTPTARPEVVAVAVAAGTPILAGALTPTEVFTVWEAGATAVKIFPAQTVGVGYGSHLRGPLPDLQFIPSGGIAQHDVAPWLLAGAAAVSVGGPLIGDALQGGSLAALADRAKRFSDLVRDFASTR
ncbi:bifunctional 4-hydroxy-2-oxoglutarate aldolase/2-dehydro-3-deoxy-phosphogluconate aldolase [Microbacterium sp. zg-Y818]|uniref:bifunctional 4-hydroxy-2-oxoglutarate aldolase/2-dehydro-3-deoxy-phosphogluconate aldolase n=1 Tax=unclassified Microbacterium TaxID=2609290 RepID=UPI00214B8045|nr:MULTISPECIES: bifunctional 4-hydroxy-2-oxoglutarate aldolase/2-dehydro-3-deoxy-phosphogluconate aldolase [unclassified Microbacterium]MCR2800232.1 bifunctional 4-hydroxy-2-oxoglutarate aldolase/2-dehydro-3-deoxy-phosphogluconate aldolase [Microbacterium sp. zg.Y818]WIM22198.1 bifunctional 4-hydroxy-2-oxoglutarate aldolase/2-dehydro-3-deoxy-phosphogluconate aldolase [Microbacterium sp. zg-Y818]